MNLETIQSFDKQQTYDSILALPKQAKQAWDETTSRDYSIDMGKVRNLVFAGMGGSNLGFRILRSVYSAQITVPMELINHYTLPAYANEETLVIASSYSGNTEETVMVTQQAVKAGCQVLVICAGGTLAELAKKHDFDCYQFDPVHNPSNQPRMGLGYSLFAQAGIFHKLGLIELSPDEISQTWSLFETKCEAWQVETNDNAAVAIAQALHGKTPIWVAAEHLEGNCRTANNQTNENAKSFSGFFAIPELNHHLMEGLKHPSDIVRHLVVIALESDLYLARNRKRFAITKQVVEKNDLTWLSYKAEGATGFAQACEVMLLSNFVTFYLAMLNEENPALIPWVDFFKKEL